MLGFLLVKTIAKLIKIRGFYRLIFNSFAEKSNFTENFLITVQLLHHGRHFGHCQSKIREMDEQYGTGFHIQHRPTWHQ